MPTGSQSPWYQRRRNAFNAWLHRQPLSFLLAVILVGLPAALLISLFVAYDLQSQRIPYGWALMVIAIPLLGIGLLLMTLLWGLYRKWLIASLLAIFIVPLVWALVPTLLLDWLTHHNDAGGTTFQILDQGSAVLIALLYIRQFVLQVRARLRH